MENYKYKVAFALLDDKNQVKKIYVDDKSDSSVWLQDQPTSYTLDISITLPSGKYSRAIIIVNLIMKPGLKLVVNAEITSEMWPILGIC